MQDEVSVQARFEQELDARYQEYLLKVANRESWMRVVLSVVLVIGTLLVIGIGVSRDDVELEKFSLLLAPVIGLTGIAIGYYFGRSTPPRIRSSARNRAGDDEETGE